VTPARRTPDPLDALFAPKSIAVVGASDDPHTINGRTLAYLRAAFDGDVVPVHPRHQTVQGLPAVPRLSDLTAPPDVVIVAIRAGSVLSVAEEAAELGVPALLVYSSGFAETGIEGARLQERLVALARQHGMRVFGPNCIGLMNVPAGVLATFAELRDPAAFRPGGVALVSQSGAFGAMMFKAAQREHIGVSYFAGTGNEADISLVDVLGYYVERDDVHTVLAFAEQIADPEGFLRVAGRARELDKPIVFLKVGRSDAGARAAVSHTGSLTGADRVVDAAFRQYGVVRADTTADLLAYARIFEHGRRPAGRRVGIVTVSGGVGVMLADAAVTAGLQVPGLTGESYVTVAATIPRFGAAGNPVDCTAQVGVNDRAALGTVLRTVAGLPDIDMLCYAGLSDDPNDDWLNALDVLRTDVSKPAVVCCATPLAQQKVSGRGIPCYVDGEAAMRGLAALARFRLIPPLQRSAPAADASRQAAGAQILRGSGNGRILPDDAGRLLLAGYGIPFPAQEQAPDARGAMRAAVRVGFPVALKAISPDLPHKSDAGGVRLGLRSAADVRRAYGEVLAAVTGRAPDARIAGVLVQQMVPPGLELVVGMHRDAQFGPVVTVGLGGTATEIIDRTASRLAPLREEEAMRALAEVAAGRLVTHARGLSRPAQHGVAAIAVALGTLGSELAEVAEVDLNPVIVGESGVVAVDALVTVAAP
jgi:acetate---CoA ligase (ADP-forming)